MQDGFILWSWDLVFIPLWIIFGVALLGVLYSSLVAAVFSRTSHIGNDQRRASSHAALGHASIVIPSLASLVIPGTILFIWTRYKEEIKLGTQIMLTKKLDGDLDLPYSIVVVPFLMALTSLILRSFNARGGNLCKKRLNRFIECPLQRSTSILGWCGMQKDCFSFLMEVAPSLREYGNVSYHQSAQPARPAADPERTSLSPNDEPLPPSSVVNSKKNRNVKVNKADNRTVVPILSIDIPDWFVIVFFMYVRLFCFFGSLVIVFKSNFAQFLWMASNCRKRNILCLVPNSS